VCHYIDTLQFLTGAPPTSVHAMHVKDHPDAVSIQFGFEDGSVGTIVYSSLGDASFPKEYIEVFGAGRVITIDDFRSAQFVTDGKRRRRQLVRQDKGFAAELRAFRASPTAPIPLDELHATTAATFAIQESLRTGAPAAVV
jgi:polar amino acid transport system substrate-binding protein